MGRRRTRNRSSSSLGGVVSDSAAIANSLGCTGALITGIVGFVMFYFILPDVLMSWVDYNKAKMTGPLAPIFGTMLDKVFFQRFIHPCEWAGIAILIACCAVAVWKAATQTNLTVEGARGVTIFGKLFARILD